MDHLTLWEIKARVFHRMTGHMAPGKDVPPVMHGASMEERIAIWDEWCIKYADINKAYYCAIEDVLD